MASLCYAKQILDGYTNNASVWYDKPSTEQPLGTGNAFILADYNNTMAIIQSIRSRGIDEVSFVFPVGQVSIVNLWNPQDVTNITINKYGGGGGCILIGDLLHCFLSVQVKVSSTVNQTRLWHMVIKDIVVK